MSLPVSMPNGDKAEIVACHKVIIQAVLCISAPVWHSLLKAAVHAESVHESGEFAYDDIALDELGLTSEQLQQADKAARITGRSEDYCEDVRSMVGDHLDYKAFREVWLKVAEGNYHPGSPKIVFRIFKRNAGICNDCANLREMRKGIGQRQDLRATYEKAWALHNASHRDERRYFYERRHEFMLALCLWAFLQIVIDKMDKQKSRVPFLSNGSDVWKQVADGVFPFSCYAAYTPELTRDERLVELATEAARIAQPLVEPVRHAGFTQAAWERANHRIELQVASRTACDALKAGDSVVAVLPEHVASSPTWTPVVYATVASVVPPQV
eukprot:jgi/Mesvir1/13172/Mv06135-RA.1